jgi:predicted nucleic acid-binding protein
LTVYADTSFFVSLYGSDVHSSAARRLISSHPVVWFTPLHQAEWLHAIGQHIFRCELSAAEALQVQRDLDNDRASGLWKETSLPEMAFEICAELARRHGARLGVRTLDSLHVACALELKAKQFWTFDERQAKLAQAEGLQLI